MNDSQPENKSKGFDPVTEGLRWAAIAVAVTALVLGFKAAFLDAPTLDASPLMMRYGNLIYMSIYFAAGAAIASALWFATDMIKKFMKPKDMRRT